MKHFIALIFSMTLIHCSPQLPTSRTYTPDSSNSPADPSFPPGSSTFDVDIMPLITRYCLSCHDVGGNSPVLATMNAMNTDAIYCNLAKNIVVEVADEKDMPEIAPLNPAQIDIFKKWRAAGYPKNASDSRCN